MTGDHTAAQHRHSVEHSFAGQAARFEAPGYVFSDRDVIAWMLEQVPCGGGDVLLDVAGGTGQVARAFAPSVRYAVVLDLTPEMLAAGKREADAAGVANVLFERGDAAALPYLDASFDIVVNRFAVHHFQDPEREIGEMARVCRPGGRVAIFDLIAREGVQSERHNELERLRDPSHSRALTLDELTDLVTVKVAPPERIVTRERSLDVDGWLRQAGTAPAADGTIREAVDAELAGGPETGMRPTATDGRTALTQLWAIAVARKREDG